MTRLLIVLLLLLTGCGTARPAVYADDLDRVRAELLDGLSVALGPRPWRTAATGQRSLCGSGSGSGTRAWLPTSTLDTGYPERQWPRLRTVVRRVAHRHGFDLTLLDVVRPGLLELDLVREDGAEIDLEVTARAVRL